MAKHNISISLSDEEEAFLKWLVKYDSRRGYKETKNSELQNMLSVELMEQMDLFRAEMEADQK